MKRDTVVIGASAGGVEALRGLAAQFPADLAAAVLVVLHVPANGHSVLPAILDRAGPLPAQHATDGERLLPGRIYIAPPDQHLLVEDGIARTVRGPRENGHRPAVDVLFRSAALWRGSRVIGVILSGSLDDGTAGLVRVAAEGGRAIVQDPDDAAFDGMPLNALNSVPGADVYPLRDIGSALQKMLEEEVAVPAVPPEPDQEVAMAELALDALFEPERAGMPSGLSCPDCSGGLFEIVEKGLVRYRCRVGHAWSGESLLASQGLELERALWVALRSLEEKAALSRQLSAAAEHRGAAELLGRYSDAARETAGAAATIRALLVNRTGDTGAST